MRVILRQWAWLLLIAPFANGQTLDTPRRAVTDPGVVTTRQSITPAGVPMVFDGRVFGVALREERRRPVGSDRRRGDRRGLASKPGLHAVPVRAESGLPGYLVRFRARACADRRNVSGRQVALCPGSGARRRRHGYDVGAPAGELAGRSRRRIGRWVGAGGSAGQRESSGCDRSEVWRAEEEPPRQE